MKYFPNLDLTRNLKNILVNNYKTYKTNKYTNNYKIKYYNIKMEIIKNDYKTIKTQKIK